MPETLRIATLTGADIQPHLPALARLRITVFRDWPYLYEGDEAYEAGYLATYVNSPGAAVVIAFAGSTPVGAATCLPLLAETGNVIAPFRARGLDPARFFYFGESVLLRPWRGGGTGVAFFAHREAHARAVSACDYATFCSVIRSPADPRRPADAVPLDGFWRKRGYTPAPDLACTMSWREVGERAESEKRLGFWLKSLSGAPVPAAGAL